MNETADRNLIPEVVRRPKKATATASTSSWMITFSDMVTLLLTLLVMIISITTLDPHTAFNLREGMTPDEESTIVQLGDGSLLYADRGMLAPVIELVENLDKIPENIIFDQREIKNAIFQLDPVRTWDYEQWQYLTDHRVSVFRDNRGLVVQWDRSLLFPEGSVIMHDNNTRLLQKLTLFLKSLSRPVSVESHTDPLSPLEGGATMEAYELSLRRSKAVMEYLVSLGVAEQRFRIGGHGGTRPRTLDPERSWENSRVEIIILQPDPSSLFGR